MGGYSVPSLQTTSTVPATQIPAAPALPFIFTPGSLSGEIHVQVTVPTLSAGGPPLTVPVTQMTLFYALTDISTYSTDELFAQPETIVARQTLNPAPIDVTVTFDITGLAPGAGYFFRCAAST